MAWKLYEVIDLAEQHVKEVSQSPINWMGYMDTASRIYRYTFKDSLLIHAQKPSAKACAELGLWNNKMGRWINRGSKGIALIDETGTRKKLRYVFDISDTHLGRGGRTPFLWWIGEEITPDILEYLTYNYDLDEENTPDLSSAIFQIAENYTDDYLEDTLDELYSKSEITMDQDEMRDRLRALIINSSYYMMAKRCGLDPMEKITIDSFSDISLFRETEALTVVGDAVHDITEPVLKDIGKEVGVVLKEFYRENSRRNLERQDNVERANAIPETVRKEAEELEEIKTENDPALEDKPDIEDTGGPSPGIDEGTEEKAEEAIENEVTEEEDESEYQEVSLDSEEEEEPEEEITEEDQKILDTLPELPTADEQRREIEGTVNRFYIDGTSVTDEIANEILRSGSNKTHSQLRIAYRYMADSTEEGKERRVEFLKDEYRTGGKGFVINGEEYALWFDEKGLAISKGNTVAESENDIYYLNWNEAEERIHALVENGEYAPKAILDAAEFNETREVAEHFAFFEREVSEEVRKVVFGGLEDKITQNFPDTEKNIQEYISTPEGINDLIERVTALNELYQNDHDVMRSGWYKPEKTLEKLEVLKAGLNKRLPFREDFSWKWNEYDIFITQDEIDRYLSKGGSFSESKLSTYSFFLNHDDLKERAEHIKDQYGIGGSSPAFGNTDNSYADYDSKGLRLKRGKTEEKRSEVLLKWNTVAKRIDHLLKTDRFMSAKDYEGIPAYERKQIAIKVISFFSRLPENITKPIEIEQSGLISDYWDVADKISQRFDDYDKTTELLKLMDDALAVLPLDFKEYSTSYDEKAELLADIHSYAEGSFTLFPVKTFSETEEEKTKQMSLFDLMGQEEGKETDQEPEVIEEAAEETAEPEDQENKSEAVFKLNDGSYLEIHRTDNEWDYTLYDTKLNETDGGRFEAKIGSSVYNASYEILEYLGLNTEESYLRENEVSSDEWEKRLEEKNRSNEINSLRSEGYSQDQLDVIETARREGKDITRLLDPSYSPEQMQLILDITDRVEAEKRAAIDHVYKDITEGSLDIEEINRIRRENNLPLEKAKPGKEETKNNVIETIESDGIFSGVKVIDGGVDSNGLRSVIIDLKGDYIENNIETKQPEFKPVNFKITDDDLGLGGPKAKFRANVEAIKLLKRIEDEERHATPEEQEILSKYVGWGGLSKAFDSNSPEWEKEYQELKSVLDQDEYREARESTLSAFYTPPVVIKEMYNTLKRMGLEKGNVLEPSCGVGNFMGLMPDDLNETKMYGVELDSISGRIAKELYQKNKIYVKGFEETDFSDSFFDCVIGNVPFGQFKVNDKRYDRFNFLIHDYFIAKSLDLTRPGGVVAVITSKGTMDKKGEAVRQYIADRAELLGAVRLPNDTFKGNAGTEAVSDILFLKKRDRIAHSDDSWIKTGQITGENGDIYEVNNYFTEHPEMIIGDLALESTQYGKLDVTVNPKEGTDLAIELRRALLNINGSIEENDTSFDDLEDEPVTSIEADPDVKNYSYTNVNGEVYYRENSRMYYRDLPRDTASRILGMIKIRDTLRELFALETGDGEDAEIELVQNRLNKEYDTFTAQYGQIRTKANQKAFKDDSSYYLLTALEDVDEEGKFIGKADIFTKRTIRKAEPVTSVDTASEALAVSIGEKAVVDLPFMAELTGKTEEEITEDLKGVIFKNPETEKWETADEYLSGNVRNKLRTAERYALNDPQYDVNREYLKKVQPKDLDASEIEVRLGATWLDPSYIEQFMHDTFETPWYMLGRSIKVNYAKINGTWNISGKSQDYGNSRVYQTYGTSRLTGYKILEDTLNLKDIKIYDTIEDDEGRERRVLNKKETILAQQKQEMLKDAFKEWIFKDMKRRDEIVRKYNELFNSVRPREYDGSHIRFNGMTDDVQLRTHQKNAVAHILYGDNTLLAHTVGAGKTYDMVAAGMESKRLGLCNKCLYVVPNHLTEQWGSDFLKLYPGANILVATKKDFEPANRKKFCSRIATGDYDAVIIGHTQFEKIPLSLERQKAFIQEQIDDITEGIREIKKYSYRGSDNYSVKQMEKTRKSLLNNLNKLNDQKRKDDVVTFEQLGIDRLFVDESHNFKNLFLYTKMNNVAGISQTNAQKSFDMFMKCRYMDEHTGGKGITFATGTPVSNSMVELYTIMRYLQYDKLKELELDQFDAWAASFGETITAIELAPEGTGYRAKTRFSRFYNLPELISLFKEAADVQTADMLNLPVPEAEYINEKLDPTDIQKDMVESFSERAEAVRSGYVNPSVDNMLKITTDGRKLALDQRLSNDMLPDDPGSKVNRCVENIFNVWEESKETLGTQLVFCDMSTPKGDGSFNVYDDIREKLVSRGIPREEIVFIHEANTESKRTELFEKVRKGTVRVLLGSTPKLGAGTNVQDRLIALHHLDCPWKPSDLEQQEGRILRQGNMNPKVKIFRYVTEGTFDAYMWQVVENKQKFISQIMTSKSPVRSCEDVDDTALSYAEIKALATGNPHIKEKMDLDIQVSKLKLARANYISGIYKLEEDIVKRYPVMITALKQRIEGLKKDFDHVKPVLDKDKEQFRMTVSGKEYTEMKDAGSAIIQACAGLKAVNSEGKIGTYEGFDMIVGFDTMNRAFTLTLKRQSSYTFEIGNDPMGNIRRINNALGRIESELTSAKNKLENVENQLTVAKEEVNKPFPQEKEYREKSERLNELNSLLNMDDKGYSDSVGVDEDTTEEATEQTEAQDTVYDNVVEFPTVNETSAEYMAAHDGNKPGYRVLAVKRYFDSVSEYKNRNEYEVLDGVYGELDLDGSKAILNYFENRSDALEFIENEKDKFDAQFIGWGNDRMLVANHLVLESLEYDDEGDLLAIETEYVSKKPIRYAPWDRQIDISRDKEGSVKVDVSRSYSTTPECSVTVTKSDDENIMASLDFNKYLKEKIGGTKFEHILDSGKKLDDIYSYARESLLNKLVKDVRWQLYDIMDITDKEVQDLRDFFGREISSSQGAGTTSECVFNAYKEVFKEKGLFEPIENLDGIRRSYLKQTMPDKESGNRYRNIKKDLGEEL